MADDDFILLVGKDISLSSGYTGSLTVTIPVGSDHNGEAVTILHCVNGELRTYTAQVTGGKVTFTVTSLSPFAVFADADDALDTVPKTGDGGGFSVWVGIAGLILLAAGGGLMALRRRKEKA